MILLVLAIGVSCRSGKPAASGSKVPDSLSVTITALNLSEDLTGNDEVLIIFYVDNDTSALDESFFHKRVVLNRKSHTCKLKSKIPSGFSTRALVVFLLELDAELPF